MISLIQSSEAFHVECDRPFDDNQKMCINTFQLCTEYGVLNVKDGICKITKDIDVPVKISTAISLKPFNPLVEEWKKETSWALIDDRTSTYHNQVTFYFDNLVIDGANHVITPSNESCEYLASGDISALMVSSFHEDQESSLSIKNFHIDGSKWKCKVKEPYDELYPLDGLVNKHHQEGNEISISNLKIYDVSGYGIKMSSSPNVVVENNVIRNIGSVGIHSCGVVKNNEVSYSLRGIDVDWSCNDMTISGNKISYTEVAVNADRNCLLEVNRNLIECSVVGNEISHNDLAVANVGTIQDNIFEYNDILIKRTYGGTFTVINNEFVENKHWMADYYNDNFKDEEGNSITSDGLNTHNFKCDPSTGSYVCEGTPKGQNTEEKISVPISESPDENNVENIEKPILNFVDQTKDPSNYIKRYMTEADYREWFDTNFPEYTIWEGIGMSIDDYQNKELRLIEIQQYFPTNNELKNTFEISEGHDNSHGGSYLNKRFIKHYKVSDTYFFSNIKVEISKISTSLAIPDDTWWSAHHEVELSSEEISKWYIEKRFSNYLNGASVKPENFTPWDLPNECKGFKENFITTEYIKVFCNKNNVNFSVMGLGNTFDDDDIIDISKSIIQKIEGGKSSSSIYESGPEPIQEPEPKNEPISAKSEQTNYSSTECSSSFTLEDGICTMYNDFTMKSGEVRYLNFDDLFSNPFGPVTLELKLIAPDGEIIKNKIITPANSGRVSTKIPESGISGNYETIYTINYKEKAPITLRYITYVEGQQSSEPEPGNICGEGTVYQNGKCVLNEKGGGCLIATAAFGSEMAPQVQFLRELRDNTVLQTQSGTSFMTGFNQFYYSFSPAVADLERENPAFKEAVKLTLTPLLTSLTLLNYVDIDTEQEMLGYGIGVILLNIGMYFIAPAVLIKRIFL